MELAVCTTDDDYERWRAVRIAVLPYERCDSVEEMRAQDSPTRLMLLARHGGHVVGSGLADRSETAGAGSVAPRVLPEHRRSGIGTSILHRLVEHLASLGLPTVRATVDDDGSLAFAHHLDFHDVGHEVEQTRQVVGVPAAPALPPGVQVVTARDRPGLWPASYERFGREVLSDFALDTPLDVTPERWASAAWCGDPMFLAVHGGEVVACAGLFRDTDEPRRAEHALTAVRRDWRRRGLAQHLKVRTLDWASEHGIDEVYTWTQDGNDAMRSLNERLGYATTRTSTFVSRALPLG
jgi:mycothiol synthase